MFNFKEFICGIRFRMRFFNIYITKQEGIDNFHKLYIWQKFNLIQM